jgi:hypothetical protein
MFLKAVNFARLNVSQYKFTYISIIISNVIPLISSNLHYHSKLFPYISYSSPLVLSIHRIFSPRIIIQPTIIIFFYLAIRFWYPSTIMSPIIGGLRHPMILTPPLISTAIIITISTHPRIAYNHLSFTS